MRVHGDAGISADSTPPAKASAATRLAPATTPIVGALKWIDAPPSEEPVDVMVRKELGAASAEGRALIVYVGATWCEPCKHFHEAVASHKLDADFPKLTIVAFDRDRDNERLAIAGYASQYIPLFAVPKPNGTASERMMEGSVKGEGAVGEIAPRLRKLLGD